MLRRRALRIIGRTSAAGWIAASGLSGLVSASASAQSVMGGGPTRIALLLPPDDGAYRTAAAAVLAGVQAAHLRDGRGIAIELYDEPANYDECTALYRSFSSRSIQLVVGPLTRDAVGLLGELGQLRVRTLTLNYPDLDSPTPGNAVLFGLSIESESGQIARFAFDEGTRRAPWRRPLVALTISNSSPLGRRSAQAFIDMWQLHGGTALEPVEIDTRVPSELRAALRRNRADVYFVAVHPDVAGMLRTVLGADAMLYGSSMLNVGFADAPGAAVTRAARELDGLRLVAMPWQVQPAHPAVMAYPKSYAKLPHVELQRLYALGIDAFRIARELLAGRDTFELDGVTGNLRLEARGNPRVAREMVIATYQDGVVVALGVP